MVETARIYFTPLQVLLLTDRLDEPAEVAATIGVDAEADFDAYSAVVDRCDALNSTLKAARFIVTPLSDLEKRILADCIVSTRYHEHPASARGAARVIANTSRLLLDAGVDIRR